MLKTADEKRKQEEEGQRRRQALAEMKKRALEEQAKNAGTSNSLDTDSDDDLEIFEIKKAPIKAKSTGRRQIRIPGVGILGANHRHPTGTHRALAVKECLESGLGAGTGGSG